MQGTTGILASALKHAPQAVQRIAITSSCAAVLTPSPQPGLFSEDDWNEASIKNTEAQGRDATPIEKYRASKTLAERAAWKFWEEHKGEVAWNLVVLNPPFVFGPVIHEVGSAAALNESARDWYNTVVGGAKDDAALAIMGCVFCCIAMFLIRF